jgi:polyhydroxybutyrate depolymerase
MKRVRPRVTAWAILLTFGCRGSNGDPQTGSETHFLVHCENTCALGLTCLCGVCSRACSNSDECSALASGATCVPVASRPPGAACANAPTPSFCDLACGVDADCAGLTGGHRCLGGYCRLPPDGGAAAVCPATSLVPGDNDGSVQVGDTTRTYVVRVPASYAGTSPVPLVLDFHALAGSPSGEAQNSGYRELAELEGFIVAWPQGIDDAWNIGPCCTTSRTVDDVGFAKALVQKLEQEACIDPKRVYAVGFSMGGGMALYLGCNAADVFAGIAPSAFDLLVDSEAPCQPTRPVTEIAFRGTADTVVPYDGGATKPPNGLNVTVTFLGAVGTFQKWAALDQCTDSPSAANANGCSTYAACQGGTQVTLCTTQGGNQAWGSAALGWAALKAHSMP